MESWSRPSKISRIAGKAKPTRLGNSLEHGQGGVNGLNCKVSSGFTLMQLQELEHQALIYKYIEAGIPIPFHLIMPIWKSVANSLSTCKLNPNSLGYGALYTSSLDREPGRCRRTDGKKWRCSKGVVTGQKYCERHMHRDRDRQHSRKHAETSQPTAAAATTTITTI